MPPTRAVMLDIGDDAGALLLDSTPEREGLEVEIHPVGDPSTAARRHVYVLGRDTPSGRRLAAVFPSLPPGRYVVLEPDGSHSGTVEVEAGRVATGRWREPGLR